MRKSRIFIPVLFLSQVLANQKETPPQLPNDIARTSIEYKAEGLKDPFLWHLKKEVKKTTSVSAGQSASERPFPSLTIQGIIWGGVFPQAIINNKVVKVGDTLEGARIIGINKDGIRVLFEGREKILPSPAAGTRLQSGKKPEGGNNEK